MEKINFSRSNWNQRMCIQGCIALLCSALVMYCLYFLIKSAVNHTHDKNVLYAIGCIVLYPFFAKFMFENVISLLRFYNLRVNGLSDKLVLYTERKKCEIPMTKRTNVMYYMHGWLISWPSEKGYSIILLTEDLLVDHFLDLCLYFQERTNYIPSRNIIHTTQYGVPIRHNGLGLDDYQPNADYDAAAGDQKKLLESLNISKWNRLKYIKWPS